MGIVLGSENTAMNTCFKHIPPNTNQMLTKEDLVCGAKALKIQVSAYLPVLILYIPSNIHLWKLFNLAEETLDSDNVVWEGKISACFERLTYSFNTNMVKGDG